MVLNARRIACLRAGFVRTIRRPDETRLLRPCPISLGRAARVSVSAASSWLDMSEGVPQNVDRRLCAALRARAVTVGVS
jgi:hypothetical protein